MEIKEPNWQRINLVVELVIIKHEYEIAIEKINKNTNNEFPFNIIKLIKFVDAFNIYAKKLKFIKSKLYENKTFAIKSIDESSLFTGDQVKKLLEKL